MRVTRSDPQKDKNFTFSRMELSGPNHISACRDLWHSYEGKEKPINKEHIRKFGGRYASEVSRGQFGGESRDTRDVRPDLRVITHTLDRMSAGQRGHSHGTNRTHPRDSCNPNVGVSRRISLCLLFFSSRLYPAALEAPCVALYCRMPQEKKPITLDLHRQSLPYNMTLP